MAELILTDAEKAAALWSDLDDEALGKLVRKKISFLTNAADQMDRVVHIAAAMLICGVAVEQKASQLCMEIEGFTIDGVDCGEWSVVAKKASRSEVQEGG